MFLLDYNSAMSTRAFRLPADIDTMNSLVMEGFQYPENPSWSVQADEKQGMIDSINAAKRLWPLLRVLRIFSPVFRDALCGFIDEQDGNPAGLINFLRQRNVPEWWIGNVTVLPAYRRRGIARRLVEATLDDLRRRNAHTAFLEVVDGNLPAFNLYKEMGFEPYAMTSQYDYDSNAPVQAAHLPDGCSVKPLSPFDWRTRYVFAQGATPESVKQYEPVLEERFRIPFIMPLFGRLFNTLGGRKSERFAVYSASGQASGFVDLNYRIRDGGVNQANLRIDPNHSEAAPFMIAHVISTIQKASPGRRIEIHLENWGPALIEASEAIGGVKRLSYHRMGLRF